MPWRPASSSPASYVAIAVGFWLIAAAWKDRDRDLMHSAEVKRLVREAYRNVPPTTAAVARRIYSPQELAEVPQAAVDGALGVANHLRFAHIRPGETVLDLGCGGGIDTILGARRTGRAIALDFLPEMLTHTARAVTRAELGNVEPLEGRWRPSRWRTTAWTWSSRAA